MSAIKYTAMTRDKVTPRVASGGLQPARRRDGVTVSGPQLETVIRPELDNARSGPRQVEAAKYRRRMHYSANSDHNSSRQRYAENHQFRADLISVFVELGGEGGISLGTLAMIHTNQAHHHCAAVAHPGDSISNNGCHDRHAGPSVAMFRDKVWLTSALVIPVVFWSDESANDATTGTLNRLPQQMAHSRMAICEPDSCIIAAFASESLM
jgi:hypothetical protein